MTDKTDAAGAKKAVRPSRKGKTKAAPKPNPINLAFSASVLQEYLYDATATVEKQAAEIKRLERALRTAQNDHGDAYGQVIDLSQAIRSLGGVPDCSLKQGKGGSR